MKINFEIRDTYDDAEALINTCSKPMYILHGDNNKYWVVDLHRANYLIKKGYKIASKEAETVEIISKGPEKYLLQNVGKKCHRIVKILREYEDEQQAIDDLTRLLEGEITEQEIADRQIA